jgi:hypothetical protein
MIGVWASALGVQGEEKGRLALSLRCTRTIMVGKVATRARVSEK